jgi:G3E family GTPase
MKLILFTGFLGAGKTTCVLSFSQHLLLRLQKGETGHCAQTQVPLVILENEIGDIAYDGAMLKNSGLEVRNLLSGCICCTLNMDLISELRDIRSKYDPKYIIFEPSGAAFPNKIMESVSQSGIEIEKSTIITILDVLRFPALMTVMPHLIEEQIACAHTILLSKTDLLEPGRINTVLEKARHLNRTAGIYQSPYGTTGADALWEEVLKNNG